MQFSDKTLADETLRFFRNSVKTEPDGTENATRRAVGIDVFLRRAGDVNPLMVDAGRIRGLTSPARQLQPQSSQREEFSRIDR